MNITRAGGQIASSTATGIFSMFKETFSAIVPLKGGGGGGGHH
jgi:hypothetical protein